MPTKKNTSALAGQELVDAVVDALNEKLAEQIVVLDLRGISSAADWFIICQGDNTSHTTAIADGVIDKIRETHGTKPWHFEGLAEGRWALIDYSDVIVHVMLPDVRKHYNLEKLWGNVTLHPVV